MSVRVAVEPDWNKYGDNAPTNLAVQTSRNIFMQLKKLGFPPNLIVRSGEGGVGLVYLANGKQADFEIYNDGDVLAGIYHLDKLTEIIDLADSSVPEVAEKIRLFLYPAEETE